MSCQGNKMQSMFKEMNAGGCGCNGNGKAGTGPEYENISGKWLKENSWWIVGIISVIALLKS